MTEDEFWKRLEWRICREMSAWSTPPWKHVWCDGIVGYVARSGDGAPYIWGDIWIGPDGQTRTPFKMTVPENALHGDIVLWEALLPAEAVTAWLHVDLEGKHVTIDLSKAEPI